MVDGLVAITSGELTAKLNPLGAELWSLTDRAGREYMTDADPAFWTGHAPLLFPIVGMLANGRYRLDGREYAMPKHGFARKSRFEVLATAADCVGFRLTDSAQTRAIFPFAFVLDLDFRIAGMTLAIAATVTNPGEQTLPFSFGFHPAFAWPLPGGAKKNAHRVVFAQPEPAPIRRIDPASGLLVPEPHPTPVEGCSLTPTSNLFEPDALIWDHLASRALSFGASGGSWIDLTFPDTPLLGIWQKPGASYLCLEPWQGIADLVGYTGDFRDKPGVVELAAGESRQFRLSINVRPA